MEDGFLHFNGSQGRRAFHADVTIYCCWVEQWWGGVRDHEALIAQFQSQHGFTSRQGAAPQHSSPVRPQSAPRPLYTIHGVFSEAQCSLHLDGDLVWSVLLPIRNGHQLQTSQPFSELWVTHDSQIDEVEVRLKVSTEFGLGFVRTQARLGVAAGSGSRSLVAGLSRHRRRDRLRSAVCAVAPPRSCLSSL